MPGVFGEMLHIIATHPVFPALLIRIVRLSAPHRLAHNVQEILPLNLFSQFGKL